MPYLPGDTLQMLSECEKRRSGVISQFDWQMSNKMSFVTGRFHDFTLSFFFFFFITLVELLQAVAKNLAQGSEAWIRRGLKGLKASKGEVNLRLLALSKRKESWFGCIYCTVWEQWVVCEVGNILLAQLLIFPPRLFILKKITFLHFPPLPNSPFRDYTSPFWSILCFFYFK